MVVRVPSALARRPTASILMLYNPFATPTSLLLHLEGATVDVRGAMKRGAAGKRRPACSRKLSGSSGLGSNDSQLAKTI
jgi:hypothetical protein